MDIQGYSAYLQCIIRGVTLHMPPVIFPRRFCVTLALFAPQAFTQVEPPGLCDGFGTRAHGQPPVDADNLVLHRAFSEADRASRQSAPRPIPAPATAARHVP
jgi:hypothetical protein